MLFLLKLRSLLVKYCLNPLCNLIDFKPLKEDLEVFIVLQIIELDPHGVYLSDEDIGEYFLGIEYEF